MDPHPHKPTNSSRPKKNANVLLDNILPSGIEKSRPTMKKEPKGVGVSTKLAGTFDVGGGAYSTMPIQHVKGNMFTFHDGDDALHGNVDRLNANGVEAETQVSCSPVS
ncbi:DUF488 domain-containing protein [Sesbania bispinosa]|nr:DUF488 domain-containing protein [Sesbania bispinosa]